MRKNWVIASRWLGTWPLGVSPNPMYWTSLSYSESQRSWLPCEYIESLKFWIGWQPFSIAWYCPSWLIHFHTKRKLKFKLLAVYTIYQFLIDRRDDAIRSSFLYWLLKIGTLDKNLFPKASCIVCSAQEHVLLPVEPFRILQLYWEIL